MYKKLLGSLILVCSLMFVSCEQDNKNKDKKTARSYDRKSYKNDREKRSMPSTCPKEKPCPSPEKKPCPNGCKKKCCVNRSDLEIQEMQETISVNEIKPLEDLKASLEKTNALDELGSELE